MPKGIGAANEAAKEAAARRESYGQSDGQLWLKVGDGDTQVVRFLEQGPDVCWAYMHEMKEGGQFKGYEVCRNQDENGNANGEPCLGCEKNAQDKTSHKRKGRGVFNVIWRNAPVYKMEKNSDGNNVFSKDASGNKIVERYEDQLAEWNTSMTVVEMLYAKDVTFKGLGSRDFSVSRSGTGLETEYSIEPVVDDEGNSAAVPMSDADKALAANKPDLTPKVTPRAYEDYGKKSTAAPAGDSGGSGGGSSAPSSDSPFFRKKEEG